VTDASSEDTARDALRRVFDPEVGLNIVDLGLVYAIEPSEQGLRVELTMTSAACPMADLIIDDAREALRSVLPKDSRIDIELVWDPPWTPERMSDLARAQFGWAPR
jgi:metal-sulfur cluster biosynthetic enzyme